MVSVRGKTKQFKVKINWNQNWKEQDVVDLRNTLAKLFKRQPQEFFFKSIMDGCIEPLMSSDAMPFLGCT